MTDASAAPAPRAPQPLSQPPGPQQVSEAGSGPAKAAEGLSAANAAYEAKVQDLARETRRVELLITAIKNDGHRADAPHPFCGLCRALDEVTWESR